MTSASAKRSRSASTAPSGTRSSSRPLAAAIAAARGEHRVEFDATRLIDRQSLALDGIARATQQRGAREVASGLGKAMCRRSDLGLHQRCAIRVVYVGELRGERIQTVECVQVTEKLRCKMLVLDDRLGSSREAWVAGEPGPGATARALQVDRGDLPIGCGWTGWAGSSIVVIAASEARLQTSETGLDQRRHDGSHDDVGLIVGQELHRAIRRQSRFPSA